MFEGSFAGNLFGFLYFVLFLLGGGFLSFRLLRDRDVFTRVWLGGVFGLVLLMWLPVACSFLLGFNLLSHLIAALLLLGGVGACAFLTRKKENAPVRSVKRKAAVKEPLFSKDNLLLILPVLALTVFFAVVEANHILQPTETGYIFGQSTYNDAMLHMSFITAPVAQGTMPFYYNIQPDVQVSYPFLSDTVSASVYLFGTSLRLAYLLPVIAGAFLVFLGAMLFFRLWLKKTGPALLAWSLFFFNGGFGFAYFLDNLRNDPDNFSRMFTNLYETPTNLDGKMIRFVNTVCDMMIPQRATLFGWMMLFPILWLLYRAVFGKEKKYFVFAGILAGLTPLISTHIFLAVGLISAVWMLAQLYRMSKLPDKYARFLAWGLAGLTVFVFAAKCLSTGSSLPEYDLDAAAGLTFRVTGICLALLYVYFLLRALFKGHFKELLSTWGLYLVIVLVPALPQLIAFTFTQTGGDGFLRDHFNWVNSRDEYLWFYVKNIGLPVLLLLPAILSGSRHHKAVAAPAAVLVLLADTFSLQPNSYDNNKLLYPAYVLVVGLVALYLCEVFTRLRGMRGRAVLTGLVLVACFASGVLSMGREAVSDEYQVLSRPETDGAEWICENTDADSVFLTGDRLYHEIPTLTGRSIVCGNGWLYGTHGLPDHDKRLRDVRAIYESPLSNRALLEKYSVDYIVVSGDETSSFSVNEDEIKEIASLVFSQGNYRIYEVHP